MSHLLSYTAEEISTIQLLRTRLQDVASFPESEMNSLAQAYISEDATMWRYSLAKSLEANPLDEAETMFRASIAWRNEINMSKLCQEWRGEQIHGGKTSTSARARMGELCFYGGIMTNRSIHGGPVLVERLGRVDLVGLYNDECKCVNYTLLTHNFTDYILALPPRPCYPLDALDCTSKSYIVYLEEAWNIVRSAGNKVRGLIIIDVAGCGLGMLGYMSVIKQLSSAGVLRYPEITERVCVVNAGWVVSALWSAIKPFLPTRTEAKFRILSGDSKSIFGDIRGEGGALPDFVGGALLEGEHSVCRAVSVDEAYGIVLNEIIATANATTATASAAAATAVEGVNESGRFTDVDEFLSHALVHAKKYSKSNNDAHQRRIEKILSVQQCNGDNGTI